MVAGMGEPSIGAWYMRGFGDSGAIRRVGVVVAAASLIALTACSGTPRADAADRKDSAPAASKSQQPAPPPLTLAVTPANKAADVLTSTDIILATTGTVRSLAVNAANGTPVAGTMATDGKTWRPATQLAYSATYSVAAAAKSGRETKTVTSTFTTMDKPSSGKLTGADLYFGDGDTVGVGMPLVVEFTRDIPVAQQAAIERRLFVTATPAAEGSWHWFSNSEIHYRPKVHWAVGTKISFRAAIGGMQMGNGKFGKRDRVANLTVGSSIVSKVNNATKTMSVFKDGVLIRTMPVSMGRPNSPTSSGSHVVMEKKPEAWFDSTTFGLDKDDPGGYRKLVYWDVRFTWGGEFTHAAPWSLADQGKRNVSHGCVNLSPFNARWFYDLSKKGDLIEIVGTERNVKPGDGWTDWNLTWPQYVAGSALR
jgi:lipoprotein-anchoring transpeptidase ErfK/SrfK